MRLPSQFLATVFTVIALFAGGVGAFAQDTSAEQIVLKRCWNYTDEKVFSVLTVDGTNAFVSTNEAQIAAVSLESGQKLWSADLGGTLVSNLEATPAGLFLVTQPAAVEGKRSSALMWRMSKETGIPSKPIELGEGNYTLRSIGSRLILVSTSGTISLYDSAEMKAAWSRIPTGSIVGEPFISNDLIAVATGDGKLIKMSVDSGEIISTQQLESKPTSVHASRDGVVFGNERGQLTSVDPDWKFRAGASINGVRTIGDSLLVSSFDNFIYLLTRSGGVVWKKRLEGRIAGSVAIDEQRIAAFSLGGENGYVIDIKRGRAVGVVPLGSPADSLVVGPQNGLGPVLLMNGSLTAFSKNGCKINGGAVVTTPPNSK